MLCVFASAMCSFLTKQPPDILNCEQRLLASARAALELLYPGNAQACTAHEVIDGPRFAAISVGGNPFMDALSTWFHHDSIIQVHLAIVILTCYASWMAWMLVSAHPSKFAMH